ncbi:antibiotic biosynthesis monooxygenase [Carbonactinospora thermoautotrophica]|uniref:putative quinol monooxygenase n=1 Tax=Carbonactinospora thermoautotrophica TaxID=1469144 RepID=UPI00227228CF|nr:putative quinol monooxygenase [Carbonactinospora thermoautotrophica]MCX9191059.1 antibiotic biosynthesis monooxygenase [Carbonactinospora thermoautotrophica]
MIALIARYRCRPGRADEVAAALRDYAPLVRAEPGCTLFLVYRQSDDPDEFRLVEHYVDDEAMQAHLNSAHFREVIEGHVVPALEVRERVILTPIAGA